MQALRQLGSGVIIAIVSVILVLGGISLAIAETLPPSATPTQAPPTLPLNIPTATFTSTLAFPTLQTETPTETASPSPTATSLPSVSCIYPNGWIVITTTSNDTIYSLAQRYRTTPENLSIGNCLKSINLSPGTLLYVPPVISTATAVPCGPPAGWVKAHVVQPGENLYRIALSYGITYPQLQAANCMGNSVLIYVGQRLWVPNVPTLTPVPGVTLVPDFPTNTPSPTASLTPMPPTATQPPQATSTLTPSFTAPPATATASITPFPSQTTSP